MELAIFSIGILGLVFAGMILLVGFSGIRRFNNGMKNPAEDWTPPATIILPCKGLDSDLKENIQSLLHQNYPDYELLIVVADSKDDSVPLIRSMLGDVPSTKARLLVAGEPLGCAEKLNNQRVALQAASEKNKVFAFVDADMRPRNDFLRRLVSPLQNDNVGATTGFRWYLPQSAGWGSLLRMVWIGGGLLAQLDRKSGFAWGGAMAMRRDMFERYGLMERWSQGLSDDMLFTEAVQRENKLLEFIPQCGTTTLEDSTLRETLEFTNRQVTISRVYHKQLWRRSFFFHAAVLGLPLVAMGLGMFSSITLPATAGLILLSLLPVAANIFVGRKLLSVVAGAFDGQEGNAIRRYKRSTLFSIPCGMLLFCINILRSLLSSKITWRGTTYLMKSPTETIILRRV